MKRRVQTARCIGGPYAGQTFVIPDRLRVHWGYAPNANRGYHYDGVGELIWINYGTDRHCYQLLIRWPYHPLLIYRDSF